PEGRPFVLLNMIATADGRATIAGRTAPIANRADYELFHALRERVDAVMVGAETIRVEGYGPMAQLAVVVTRSVDLPVERGLLAAPPSRSGAVASSTRRSASPCCRSMKPAAICLRATGQGYADRMAGRIALLVVVLIAVAAGGSALAGAGHRSAPAQPRAAL